jgi:hypothetical protein
MLMGFQLSLFRPAGTDFAPSPSSSLFGTSRSSGTIRKMLAE